MLCIEAKVHFCHQRLCCGSREQKDCDAADFIVEYFEPKMRRLSVVQLERTSHLIICSFSSSSHGYQNVINFLHVFEEARGLREEIACPLF